MSDPPPLRPIPRAAVAPTAARSHIVDTAAIVCLAIVTCVALLAKSETIAVVALTSILPVVGLRKAPETPGVKPPGAGGSGAVAMVVAFGAGLAALVGRGRA